MDTAQACFNANAATQLAVLPHLKKVQKTNLQQTITMVTEGISHKEAVQWTEAQTIAHF